MDMTIESGRKYDIVSPRELQVNLAAHHSRLVDDIVRKQIEGIKLINLKFTTVALNNSFTYAVAEGFHFSLLYCAATYIQGSTPATLNLYVTDDVNSVQAQDQVATGVTTGTVNSLSFPFGNGQLIVRGSQNLLLKSPASVFGGIITGVLIPTESVGKLYM